jgi:large subunit ribosomal protein L25
MNTLALEGTKRTDLGKKATRAVRVSELIPCVLYNGKENVHFTVTQKAVRPLIFTPHVYIVELNVGGTKVNAIKKDIQYHPVTDEILHIDFLPVNDKKAIVMEIPVKLNGLAAGVKAGGKLIQEMRYLKVAGLYTKFPDTLDIDVSELMLGRTIQVKEMSFDNIEILNAPGAVIAAVRLTRAAQAEAGSEDVLGAAGTEEATEEAAE